MPPFNVEFYQPQVLAPDGTTFTDVLDTVIGQAPGERIRRGQDPAAVLALNRRDSEFIGEAARIRMEDLPSVIDVANGSRHDLDVEEQEGLGEEIHFLYDADLDVIAVQNRGHFRAGALEKLFGDLTDTTLDFAVILSADAWERFERMDLVTKINFTIARPRDLRGRPLPALNSVFREIDEFDGVRAKSEISVMRRRNSGLNLGAVRRMISAYRNRGEVFRSLSITGAIRESDEPDAATRHGVVDFVKGRLVYTEEVERRGRGRRLDPEGCRVALRRAIRHHRQHLRRHR